MSNVEEFFLERFAFVLPYFGQVGVEDNCNPSATGESFFGLPPWWKYIQQGHTDATGVCVPTVDFSANNGIGLWAIGLAVLEILMRIAGFLAVVYIIIAGVNYITSAGNPEEANKARQRIINGFIGLAIVLVAVPAISFIGYRLG